MALTLRRSYDAHDIVSVFNNTGVTLAKGKVVKQTTTQDFAVLIAAGTDSIEGVVLEDIPDQTWGSVQMRGLANVLADGVGFTVGDDLMSNDGTATVWAGGGAGNNKNMLGKAKSTTAAGQLGEVELAGPNVIKQQ
jgi:hypothetical protein